MKQLAFFVDVSACSGGKACQMACKDKHDLPVGQLWRRVYEVAGGGWRVSGAAWVSNVVAYHVSMGCNHCERPVCVEVCPSGALRKRDDGIVLVDAERCIGCKYCGWVCPYGAPQYDDARGVMAKCHLCHDEIDVGRRPVCVTSCPMRVLVVPSSANPVVPYIAIDQQRVGSIQSVVESASTIGGTSSNMRWSFGRSTVEDLRRSAIGVSPNGSPIKSLAAIWPSTTSTRA